MVVDERDGCRVGCVDGRDGLGWKDMDPGKRRQRSWVSGRVQMWGGMRGGMAAPPLHTRYHVMRVRARPHACVHGLCFRIWRGFSAKFAKFGDFRVPALPVGLGLAHPDSQGFPPSAPLERA